MKLMNKNIIIWVFVLSFFHITCRETPKKYQDLISKHDFSNDSLFTSVLKTFTLPYSANLELDTNSLIFFGSRPFDTSFLIHLKIDSKEVTGVYYELIPTYHTELEHFADETSKLLFFEGYSFILNQENWKSIKDQANSMVANNQPFNLNDACMDCEVFGLYYDGKGNIGNAVRFRPFYKFLKNLFLDSFIVKRKPIIYKIK
jgi:hypothetical protein